MKTLTVAALAAGVVICLLASASVPQVSRTSNTLALEPGKRSPAAKISDFAWIAGHWRGPALGGIAEEVWSQPAGQSMMAMYRLIKDDAVAFYELITLSEENGTVILKLKHFHRDLKGWEEKDEVVEFPLVKMGRDEVYFDGMTFRKKGEDALHVYVRSESKDGSVGELKFPYERVK